MKRKILIVVGLLLCMLLCAGVVHADETCAHANTGTWTDSKWDNVTYEVVNNKYHNAIGLAVYEITYCYNCGNRTEVLIEEGVTEQYWHDYSEDGVCEDCGHVNTCEHSRINTWDSIEWNGRTYEAIDNEYHWVKGKLWRQFECGSCGVSFPEEFISEEGSLKEEHNYEDGSCYECGHVNTCPHSNVDVNQYIQSSTATYTPLDARKHQATGRLYEDRYCQDCSWADWDILVSESGTLTESHYFEDGVCEKCGYVNTCPHDNTNESTYVRNVSSYEAIDNRYHLAKGELWRDVYCEDCETWLIDEKIADEGSEEYTHDYVKGVCYDCGHVNTCTHEVTWTDEYIEWDTRTYEAIDNREHAVTGSLWREVYCELCSSTIENTLIAETGTLMYEHEYYNGVCEYCGHVNTCTHANASTETFISWNGRTYAPLDNRYHLVTGKQMQEVWCADCASTLETKVIAESATEEESHYYRNGVCEECKHVNTCEHANIRKYHSWNEPKAIRQIAGDAVWHEVVYDLNEYSYCSDCSEDLGRKLVKADYVDYSQHDYQNGTCVDCGYVSACAHTNTYFWDGVSTVNMNTMVDAERCQKKTTTYRYEYCSDCEAQISKNVISTNETLRMHNISGGKCSYCGYQPACTHANSVTQTGKYFESYESKDAQGHTGVMTTYSYKLCLDCGNVSDYVYSNTTGTEKHSFSDERCSCGYVSGCTHPSTKTERWVVADYYTQKNSSKHVVYGVRREAKVCTSCGEYLTSMVVEQNVSEEAAHNFDNSIRCACGYVKGGSAGGTALNGWIQAGGKWYYYLNNVKLTSNWMADSKGWVYLGADGAMMTNEWVQDSQGWCYVGADGYAVTNCWKQDSIGWCYLDGNGSMVKNNWVGTDGKWYYLDGNGYRMTNVWKQDSNGWVYLGGDGAMLTNCWVADSSGWCYVGGNGYALTNCWVADSQGWCYLNGNGSMVKNDWVLVDGKWYYLDEGGHCLTNVWKQDSNGWVYLGGDGSMLTNCWVADSQGWCYLGSDGAMVKNMWITTDGKTYWMDGSGHCVVNDWVLVGGKWYYLDGEGVLLKNDWKQDSKGWVYVGADGAMVTNAWTQDSAGWCYMGADGYAVTNEWKYDGTGWVYLGGNGSMLKNAWLEDGGNWYYLDGNGYMVTGTVNIGGTDYTFAGNGVWVG